MSEVPGGRFALLVGVNTYVEPLFPTLRFCVNDVLALEDALRGLGYTVVALHDQATEAHLQPTRDNVEAELERVTRLLRPEDTLLVHFACHGLLVGGEARLVLQDTRHATIAERALPLRGIEARMRGGQARRLVLLLDACHAGVAVGRDVQRNEAFNQLVYDRAEGFALLAGSTAQQIAQEWNERQHGVFTYFLLQALSGQADRQHRGFVTVDDIKEYVLFELRRWNVEHGGLLQEPTARTEGIGDMIVAEFRAGVPALPAQLGLTHEGVTAARLVGDPACVVRTTSARAAEVLSKLVVPMFPGLRRVAMVDAGISRCERVLNDVVPSWAVECFYTTASVSEVQAFYHAEFTRAGWREITSTLLVTNGMTESHEELEAHGGSFRTYKPAGAGAASVVYLPYALAIMLRPPGLPMAREDNEVMIIRGSWE